MSESKLQRRCLLLVKSFRKDLLAVNMHGGGWCNKGFPDLLIFGHGRVIAVELKDGDTYKIQPEQELWFKRLHGVGIDCHLVQSLDEFELVLGKEFDLELEN